MSDLAPTISPPLVTLPAEIDMGPGGTMLALDGTDPSGDHGHLYPWNMKRNRN